MGDDGLAGPPAKKRGALRQMSKDDRSDSEEERFMPSASGSFQKAPDEVIANRRIVKVRRSAPSASSEGPPSLNPFASIRLVQPVPVASAPTLAVAGESGEKEVAVKDQIVVRSKDVEGHDEGEVESAGQSVKAIDKNTHTCAGAGEAQKVENGEDKLETLSSSGNGDSQEEEAVQNEGDLGREAPNTSIMVESLGRGKNNDVQSEVGNENDMKSRVDDGNNQHIEVKERAPKENDAGKGQESGLMGTTDVASDSVARKSPSPAHNEASSVGTINVDSVVRKDSPPAGDAATSGPFSFGPSPFLSETSTAFASFSSTRTTFGSGVASGLSLGTGFAFGMAGSEGSLTLTSSPFSNSNGSSFQLFKSSQSSSAPSSTGSPLEPPASSVLFQGGMTPTGEEEENMVFGADATLFEFIDGSWKERGKGELKVNVPSGKAGNGRLLMRSKGNFRLILNASLFADIKMTNMDSRGVTFACVNSAVLEKSGLTTYALKFKDSIAAGNFRDAVDANKRLPQVNLKTPENSPSSLHGP